MEKITELLIVKDPELGYHLGHIGGVVPQYSTDIRYAFNISREYIEFIKEFRNIDIEGYNTIIRLSYIQLKMDKPSVKIVTIIAEYK
jgi:hypothetical protein